jgi:hypothetical protein|tara:strand:- start:381 stop:1469 length:1089 start_codon:yes stop_codon:yes gene_type:complete
MSDSFPNIQSVVVRIITDKPVRKTPYQVKGVFMRQYPDESIIPMLDGSYRDQFLYPRVQVKILNEQIYLIGIHEGVEPVLSLVKKFEILDFGNITFEVQDCDIEETKEQFIPSGRLVRYRFITPWVALNHMTGGKYRSIPNQEKLSFLNKLLGQNIIFLANEVGIKLNDNIFTKVKVSSLFPRPVDENKWGAFMGEFKTNFVLPNYIGIGNGITRGFGTIYGMFNPDSFTFDEKELIKEKTDAAAESISDDKGDYEITTASDVPKPKRRRKASQRPRQNHPVDKNKKQKKSNRSHKKRYAKNSNQNQSQHRRPPRTGRVLSEEFDIEDDSHNNGNQVSDSSRDPQEDEKFNTVKHHKKQHEF